MDPKDIDLSGSTLSALTGERSKAKKNDIQAKFIEFARDQDFENWQVAWNAWTVNGTTRPWEQVQPERHIKIDLTTQENQDWLRSRPGYDK